MNKKTLVKLAFLSLVVVGLTGLANLQSESNANTIAGQYVWVVRAASDPGHAECEQQNAGSECVELCMQALNGTTVSMQRYCCLEPWKIGGWDNPEECTSWLH